MALLNSLDIGTHVTNKFTYNNNNNWVTPVPLADNGPVMGIISLPED